jgi:hypothetical protein
LRRPDGAPGRAVALPGKPLMTSDAAGLVLVFQDGAGLEVRTYGWDGLPRATRHLPILSRGTCDTCTWSATSVSSSPRDGIRIAGTLQGTLTFAPEAPPVAFPSNSRAYVLALRR